MGQINIQPNLVKGTYEGIFKGFIRGRNVVTKHGTFRLADKTNVWKDECYDFDNVHYKYCKIIANDINRDFYSQYRQGTTVEGGIELIDNINQFVVKHILDTKPTITKLI